VEGEKDNEIGKKSSTPTLTLPHQGGGKQNGNLGKVVM